MKAQDALRKYRIGISSSTQKSNFAFFHPVGDPYITWLNPVVLFCSDHSFIDLIVPMVSIQVLGVSSYEY